MAAAQRCLDRLLGQNPSLGAVVEMARDGISLSAAGRSATTGAAGPGKDPLGHLPIFFPDDVFDVCSGHGLASLVRFPVSVTSCTNRFRGGPAQPCRLEPLLMRR